MIESFHPTSCGEYSVALCGEVGVVGIGMIQVSLAFYRSLFHVEGRELMAGVMLPFGSPILLSQQSFAQTILPSSFPGPVRQDIPPLNLHLPI